MKNITEFGIGCFIVLLVAGGAILATITAMLRSPAGFLALAGASVLVLGLCALLAVAGGLWVRRWTKGAALDQERAQEFVAPDAFGRLPVPVEALRNPDTFLHVLETYKASYMQNVTTYHNRPTSSTTGADAETMQIAASAPLQPFAALYHSGLLPKDGFLMGYDLETSKPVIADWKSLYSALIGGQSGSGKSTLIRSILAQAALQGGRFIVLDKHYGAGEESLGESLEPLRGKMLFGVAYNESSMVDALRFVLEVGKRRLSGADTDKTPLILVVDETTALLQRSAVANLLADVLGQIAQETRKVGVYALCIGQNFNGEIMETTVRDSFVSYVSCRAKRAVARVMSGSIEFGKAAETLTIGQAVWMTPSGDVHTLQVPNCTAADLELVAGSGFRVVDGNDTSTSGKRHFPTVSGVFPEPTDSAPFDEDGKQAGNHLETPGKATEPADARVARIRQMIKDGHNQAAIIKAVWQVENGRAYQNAQAELMSIIASLI